MEAGQPRTLAQVAVSRSKSKSESRHGDADVRAAGGVVRRYRGVTHRLEVALVHRPRYDDWSFPKGKRDGKETDQETAIREVAEETGFRCTLGADLGAVSYSDAYGRSKVVRYWVMDLAADEDGETFEPNREVDELRWCRPRQADRLLSYDHDRVLLDRLKQVRA
ncbi:MAG: NUDIX hydrolase [Actinobacteria bacterium]|nr:NUDIX hydrolase [Actinomycetota bacterium]